MYWIKGCTRCNGDLYESVDQYGEFIACIQCGHYPNEVEEAAIRRSSRLGTPSRSKRIYRTDKKVASVQDDREEELVAA